MMKRITDGYSKWGWAAVGILWLAGALVMAARMMAGEPYINLVGYLGGLMFASHVVLNATKRGARFHDWLVLVALAVLTVFAGITSLDPDNPPKFSLEVAIVLMATLGAWGFAKLMDSVSNNGGRFGGWVERLIRRRFGWDTQGRGSKETAP